ncbi:MAG: hypothetical protein P9L99_11230 [Candidatus Lernaella stagnicola]|nr:hypothetical protein [Candidatus Lernaella stagnicola]
MKPMTWLAVVATLALAVPVAAHVPYVEHADFTGQRPFVMTGNPEQSIAVYAWLETDFVSPADDIDVYQFELVEEALVYAELIVPACVGYEDYAPWYAVVGPNFPQPTQPLPFNLPEGYGAVVMENTEPGEPRTTFYEFFGNQTYYEGPVFEHVIDQPGVYYVVVWDPWELGGDYTLALGKEEIWGLTDILRALIVTPWIRQDRVLHVDECVLPIE